MGSAIGAGGLLVSGLITLMVTVATEPRRLVVSPPPLLVSR